MVDDDERDVGGEHGHAALGVVEDLGAPPDQHQRQPDRGVRVVPKLSPPRVNSRNSCIGSSSYQTRGNARAGRCRTRAWRHPRSRRSCPRPARSPGRRRSARLRAFCSTSRIVDQGGLPEPADQAHHLIDDLRCQAERRLVQQQQPGPGRAAPCAITSICRSPPDSVAGGSPPLGQHRELLVGLGERCGPVGPAESAGRTRTARRAAGSPPRSAR